MKLNKSYLLVFISLLSCKNPNSSLREIYVSDSLEEVELSKIGERAKIIQLKTAKSISQPTDILMSSSSIYVFDQNHSGILRKFDLDGNLLAEAGFFGDSRIPLDGITNFSLDHDTLNVVTNGNIIHTFDDQLSPISSKKLSHRAGFIQKHGNDYLMYNNQIDPDIPFQVFSISPQGNLSGSVPIDSRIFKPYFKAYSPFAIQKDSIFTSFPFNDTLYASGNGKEFSPLAKFDFGKRRLPVDFFDQVDNSYQLFENMKNSDSFSLHEGIQFGKNGVLITSVFHGLHTYPMIVDMESSSAVIVNHFIDDMLSGIKVRNNSYSDQNHLVFGISGEILSENYKTLSEKFRQSLPEDYQDYFYLLIVEI